MKEPATQSHLLYIATNFSSLSSSITQLEEHNSELVNALEIYQSALRKIGVSYGEIGKKIIKKSEKVSENNSGLKIIKNIKDLLVGEEVNMDRKFAQHAMYFKYAPLTSVEVERSFSKLNMLISDQRQSLKTENVRKLLIISCNRF